MGRTFKRETFNRYDDWDNKFSENRKGKKSMKIINKYVDEDYDEDNIDFNYEEEYTKQYDN